MYLVIELQRTVVQYTYIKITLKKYMYNDKDNAEKIHV